MCEIPTRQIDPKRANDLTDSEKWECTANWLRYLYHSDFLMRLGILTFEEYMKRPDPCEGCPCYEKCPCFADDPYFPAQAMYANFQIMAPFIQRSTVVGPSLRLKGSLQEDSVSP